MLINLTEAHKDGSVFIRLYNQQVFIAWCETYLNQLLPQVTHCKYLLWTIYYPVKGGLHIVLPYTQKVQLTKNQHDKKIYIYYLVENLQKYNTKNYSHVYQLKELLYNFLK